MRPWGMSDVHWRFRSGLSSRIFWVLFEGFKWLGIWWISQVCDWLGVVIHDGPGDLGRNLVRLVGLNLQSGEHVARGNAVHANTSTRPLDAERGAQVAHGRFGGVVGTAVQTCVNKPPARVEAMFVPWRRKKSAGRERNREMLTPAAGER